MSRRLLPVLDLVVIAVTGAAREAALCDQRVRREE